ncbi:NYN domain-containing protein [Actinoplanes sp. NPDC026623]|uniref:NYN domain-containing protein n=1 Tax=Actinoplanes sp. NPDC026623 TaxID=3155610 RepID=UPI0033EA9843
MSRSLLRRWPEWTGYAAAAWSLAYGILGIYWFAGGAGFPFGPAALDRRSGSMMEGVDAHVAGAAMAGIGLLGAATGVVMARSGRRGRATTALLGIGWSMAVLLTLIVQDYFLLGLIAFSPVLLVFAFTGVPGPQDGIGDILYWHRTNLLVLFAGGLLWAAATVAYRRRSRGACPHCGRMGGTHDDTSRETLHRWGRWAVLVAVLAPAPYEITRVAWFLGFPLGVPRDFLRMMQQTPGMLGIGLGCAVASALGTVLTHGLVHRWGERCPRWIWFRAGRRIPPALAVVPAAVVAAALIPAGLMNLRIPTRLDGWAINVPGMLWTVWGAALGTAAYLYFLRRRAACRRCGNGGLR